jgi:hypothetical protein
MTVNDKHKGTPVAYDPIFIKRHILGYEISYLTLHVCKYCYISITLAMVNGFVGTQGGKVIKHLGSL